MTFPVSLLMRKANIAGLLVAVRQEADIKASELCLRVTGRVPPGWLIDAGRVARHGGVAYNDNHSHLDQGYASTLFAAPAACSLGAAAGSTRTIP